MTTIPIEQSTRPAAMVRARQRAYRRAAPGSEHEHDGFTLTELLVVVGILSLLAVTLLPAYAANRSGAQAFQCLNNHRQLVLGWITHAADNQDRLPSTQPVQGVLNWSGNNPDNTDQTLLSEYRTWRGVSWMAKYMPDPKVWKCPADSVPAPNGPRVRSVSINGALSGATVNVATPSYPPDRQYLRLVRYMSELRKPAEVFVSMDEHPDSINDSWLMNNPGYLPPLYAWRDLPASYHNGAVCYSAADGRAEMHQWLEDSTMQPISRQSKAWGTSLAAPFSVDIQWMNDHMPYQEK